MTKWLGPFSFTIFVGLAVTIVVGAFLIEIRPASRPNFDGSMKDCFGFVPPELKQLQDHRDFIVSVRAASSPAMSKSAMIEVGREASIWRPESGWNYSDPSLGVVGRPSDDGENGISGYGFVAFNILTSGRYRLGMSEGSNGVALASFYESAIEIVPLKEGRIQCEGVKLSDYDLKEGLYLLKVSTSMNCSANYGRLVVTPATTNWHASWDMP